MKGMILSNKNNIVCIITFNSKNKKTGDMCQVWILRNDINPVEAIKQNKDGLICFDCIHRLNRSCYVNAGQAPLQVYKAYKKGLYRSLDLEKLSNKIKNKTVRFGAYGEPVLVPFLIVKHIIKNCISYTGYSHQWKNPKYKKYAKLFMASIDSEKQLQETLKIGLRSFRVSNNNNISDNELICPNVRNPKIQCNTCRLCDNQSKHKNAKNIVIPVHGTKGKINNFNLINI